VIIGAGTWLGIGVVVLPGVTIGQGCAVGANAVVTRDLADFSVAVGVPARVIGDALDAERSADVRQL
jgi:acetyltransferase-like isoleucine patch superfamily enzyme